MYLKPHPPPPENPLMNLFLISKPCIIFVVNLDLNLGVQILTMGIQTL